MKRINEVVEWSDAVVAQGLPEGSSEAYRELSDRFSGLIYERCIKYSACKEEALDLLNEILIRIVIVIGQYDAGKATLATWVTKITVNYLVDYYRKKKDEPELLEWLNDVFDLYPELCTQPFEYAGEDEDFAEEETVIVYV